MITGKRIRLRAIEREDLPKFHAWLNDPEVRHGLALNSPVSMPHEENWFAEMSKRPIDERPFAIDMRKGRVWRLIGNCGLFDHDWQARKAEIGIMIGDKAEWNKGYGTETMQLVIQVGFQTLNMHRLYLYVHAGNLRAIRSYEKAGFVKEGLLRQAHYDEGLYKDELIMSMLRPEWDAHQKE